MSTNKFIRIHEVVEITGLSQSTISRLEKNKEFPMRRRIGMRAVGWLENEVRDWVDERTAEGSEAEDEQV